MKQPIDVQSIYNDHLLELGEERKKELDKTKPTTPHYRPSSSGTCSRKIFYETILRVTPTDEIDKRVRRLFRLGDMVHEDIQNALDWAKNSGSDLKDFNNSNNIYNNIYNIYNIYIEEELISKKLKVRGFADLIIESCDGGIYLYDIKTIADFPYKKIFAQRKENREPSVHQELQLATYGLMVQKRFGRLDGMFILYYNKNTSMLRHKEVSNDRLLTALTFWERINKQHSNNVLPPLEPSVSPVADWECRYCNFKERCNQDN